jgi:ribosome recycling factor
MCDTIFWNFGGCVDDSVKSKPRHGQLRWKHGAKMGHHLDTLDEMAHSNSRKEAQERRKKKKGKKESKEVNSAPKNHKPSETDSFIDWDEEPEEDDEDEDETLLPDPAQVKIRMTKVVDSFVTKLKTIRGSEPTADIFDDIQVDAYGSHAPLNSVAQVVISSSTLAQATCYDPELAKNVGVAIRDKLELNPSVEEGGVVRIPLPRVSLEVRQQTAKALTKHTEKYRQRVRTIRRNVLKVVKQGEAGKLEGISKDDAFRAQKEIEDVTEKIMVKLNEAAEQKHKAIMAL